ncbi:MAG TPA: F0F1 ATP synthase subunit B [Alphaproteobacteria bacterium]|jgi:F-type H+-transporting ATPase subunit b|nr:F0F1 ATP synthase subunit B [Alphaproteobacteria bacterium]
MHIDGWTIALQAINFLILVWLLQRFLYRPVMAVIARRQAEIAKLMQAADSAKADSETVRLDLEAERGGIAREAAAALAATQKRAEAERAALLDKARAEAARLTDEARQQLARERADAAATLKAEAGALGVEIARRLLADLAPGTGVRSFLERALRELDTLPPEAKRRLAAQSADGTPVRVVAAATLSSDEEALCRQALSRALGGAPQVVFAVDHTLIAGVEVHFAHTILRHNWRDSLAEILPRVSTDGAQGHA